MCPGSLVGWGFEHVGCNSVLVVVALFVQCVLLCLLAAKVVEILDLLKFFLDRICGAKVK